MGVGRGRYRVGTVLLLAVSLLLAACGSQDSELTTEQFLQKLEGRPLTTAEMDERMELADLLCRFQGQVLNQIWVRLDARQLEFQDYVFGQHCPDRLPTYLAARPETGTASVAATTTTIIDASLLEKVKQVASTATTSTTTTLTTTTSITATGR